MSLEKSQKILKAMWEKVAKPGADGKKYIIIKNRTDLEYHYWSGFVDDDQFTVQDWIAAFQDSLLPNGMYLVNEPQWMDKASYHYSGPINAPYDPMTIREGEWTEEDLEKLVWENIKPCVYFSKEDFGKVIAEAKKSMPRSNGNYVISNALKKDWLEFMNTYASPKRVLQMGVAQLRAAKGQAASGGPAVAGSGFVQGPGPSQQVADKLSQLIAKRER